MGSFGMRIMGYLTTKANLAWNINLDNHFLGISSLAFKTVIFSKKTSFNL